MVGTGVEYRAAFDSQQVVVALAGGGTVVGVTSSEIMVERDEGNRTPCTLKKFLLRSNQGTCINQRPIVDVGNRIAEGQVLADSSARIKGEMALGQNILVAFLPWEGSSYEDAIVISERLVPRGPVHEHPHREARDRGPRHQARPRGDHPRHPERRRRPPQPRRGRNHLRGAEVTPGDILVGKITPEGRPS